MVRAAAKNFPDVGVVVDPADYDAVVERAARPAARSPTRPALRLAVKAFRHTGGLRRRGPRLPGRGSGSTGPARPDGRSSSRTADRSSSSRPRTCATERTRTRRPPSTATRSSRDRRVWPRPSSCRARNCRSTTSSTSTRRSDWPSELPRGRLRDHQARQPVRHRARAETKAALRARAGLRPAQRLRWRDRLQPRGGRPRGRSRGRALLRGRDRARASTPRPGTLLAQEEESAAARDRRPRPSSGAAASTCAGSAAGCWSRTGIASTSACATPRS